MNGALRRGRLLVLAALGLLLLWWLRPFLVTTVANNLGSIRLNRALLAPVSPGESTAWAESAGRTFQTALAWDPLNGRAYYNLNATYAVWGDTPSTASLLSRAATLHPRAAHVRFALGRALAARQQEERAIREWQAAGAAPYFLNRGLILTNGGDHAGALDAFERAAAIDPSSTEAHYRRGQALVALGREEEAIAALEMAAEREPTDSARRYVLLGEVHQARQAWSAARQAFERAADLAPADPAPYHRLGMVAYSGFDDAETAVEYLAWALRLDPDYVPARLALGQISTAAGACDEAQSWLAPLLVPEEPSGVAGRAYLLLGRCLLDEGRSGQAIPHLVQAVDLDPQAVSYRLFLAQAYAQAARYQEAIAAYRQVLALAPDNQQARQALEELGWDEP